MRERRDLAELWRINYDYTDPLMAWQSMRRALKIQRLCVSCCWFTFTHVSPADYRRKQHRHCLTDSFSPLFSLFFLLLLFSVSPVLQGLLLAPLKENSFVSIRKAGRIVLHNLQFENFYDWLDGSDVDREL